MTSMHKKYASFAAAFCILAYLASFGLAAYRIASSAAERRERVTLEFDRFVDELSSASSFGFMGDYFKSIIRQRLDGGSFAALVVTGPSGAEYVAEPVEGILSADAAGDPRIPADLPFPYVSLRAPLRSAAVRNATLSIAYSAIDAGQFRTTLRDSFLLVLAGLLVASVTLIALVASKEPPPVLVDGVAADGAGEARMDSDPARAPRSEEAQGSPSGKATEDAAVALGIPPLDEGLRDPGEGVEVAADADADAAPMAEEPAVDRSFAVKSDAPSAGDGPSQAGQAADGPKEPEGLYSPVTGVCWEEYLLERLRSELHRAASFEQDLAFLMLAPSVDRDIAQEELRTAGDLLVEFFTFRDLVFGVDSRSFAVILPSYDLEHALRMANEFVKRAKSLEALQGWDLAAGLSARAGRLVEPERLIAEATKALEKARSDAESAVVAFKPDPERYRSFIASA